MNMARPTSSCLVLVSRILTDFILESGNIMNTNTSGGELAMLLTKENGGTRISSTRYLHYGTVTATSARLASCQSTPN